MDSQFKAKDANPPHPVAVKFLGQRYYHRTGAKSYYGGKKKFKNFLHFFYKVNLPNSRNPAWKWNPQEAS
jgi:hypothetical protein